MEYFFQYNLSTGEVTTDDTTGINAVRYFNSDNGPIAEIGNGYRNNTKLRGKRWNSILREIKEGRISQDAIDTILQDMLRLTASLSDTLQAAIEKEEISEIEL